MNSEIIDLINTSPNITHILIISIIDDDKTIADITSKINGICSIPYDGIYIDLNWSSDDRKYTKLYTCHSIYNDSVTLYHGHAVVANVSRTIGKNIKSTVLRKLDLDNMTVHQLVNML